MRDQCQSSNVMSQRHLFVCILLWVALGIYMAGVWVVSGLGPSVTCYVDAIGIPDFFWHLGLYAGLAFLAIAAIRNTWPRQAIWLSAVQGAGVALSYSLLDEVHQSFVPGRGTDFQDILGNLAGVIMAAAFLMLWGTFKTSRRLATTR